jgi:DnaK suppressor protein
LSHDQRALLAALLQSELTDLLSQRAAQLSGLSQAELARQTLVQDADDASQRAGAHEVEAAISDIDSADYIDLRQALVRVRESGYGFCGDCHRAIPFARLQLEPQTLRCASCQTEHERQRPGQPARQLAS